MIPRLESRCETLPVRGITYNIRHWGPADAPQLFLLHGWLDCSATFQFVVDALQQEWHVIAPDWRGYGGSDYLNRPYWYPDYSADLDVVLAHYAGTQPVRLVGHSMGANIAGIYSAARPARVAQLAMLDFLGLKPLAPADPVGDLTRWLDNAQATPSVRTYADHPAIARRLRLANHRLSVERADFLARHISRPCADGQLELAWDAWHRVPAPYPYRLDDAMACWRAIQARVLMLIADTGFVYGRFHDDPDEYARRLACFVEAQVVTITGAGHNVQHDQPEQVAAALEAFLQR